MVWERVEVARKGRKQIQTGQIYYGASKINICTAPGQQIEGNLNPLAAVSSFSCEMNEIMGYLK